MVSLGLEAVVRLKRAPALRACQEDTEEARESRRLRATVRVSVRPP